MNYWNNRGVGRSAFHKNSNFLEINLIQFHFYYDNDRYCSLSPPCQVLCYTCTHYIFTKTLWDGTINLMLQMRNQDLEAKQVISQGLVPREAHSSCVNTTSWIILYSLLFLRLSHCFLALHLFIKSQSWNDLRDHLQQSEHLLELLRCLRQPTFCRTVSNNPIYNHFARF